MAKLEVFDPPMCCSTGICGNSVDPTLVTFASDLEWLKQQGVNVVRYGLSFHPSEFVKNEDVKRALQVEGNGSLPILVFNNNLVSKTLYPSREKLAQMCNVEFNDDEAPPVHREENCCCGIDCDCDATKLPEGIDSILDSRDSVENENIFEWNQTFFVDNFKTILLIIALLVIVTLIVFNFVF